MTKAPKGGNGDKGEEVAQAAKDLTLGGIEAISARIRQGDDMDAAWQAVMREEDG